MSEHSPDNVYSFVRSNEPAHIEIDAHIIPFPADRTQNRHGLDDIHCVSTESDDSGVPRWVVYGCVALTALGLGFKFSEHQIFKSGEAKQACPATLEENSGQEVETASQMKKSANGSDVVYIGTLQVPKTNC